VTRASVHTSQPARGDRERETGLRVGDRVCLVRAPEGFPFSLLGTVIDARSGGGLVRHDGAGDYPWGWDRREVEVIGREPWLACVGLVVRLWGRRAWGWIGRMARGGAKRLNGLPSRAGERSDP
jgi:hypothetical protein